MTDVLPLLARNYSLMMNKTHQDDQLDQTLAAHQAANGEAFAPEELVRTSGQGTTRDLADEGAHDDADDICPSDPVFQETQIGIQPGKGKVERQEQDRNEIFDLFGQLDGETAVVRADYADQEGAKDGMDTNDPCGDQ